MARFTTTVAGGSRTRRSRALAGFLAVLAVLAAACGGDDSAADGAPDADGSASAGGTEVDPVEAADRSADLTFAVSYGFNSLDPHRSPSASGDALWMRPLYDRLLTLVHTPDGVDVGPQLATSYEFAEDGSSIEFELRDDVTFQDGTPFDASAVRANIERAMAPESTVKSLLASVAGVDVVDATHVVLRLKQPDPALPWSMATSTVGMMISPAALGNSDLATKPVGSGPFRLVSAAKDADVVYERWDDHWDPDAALVATLTVSTIADGNARLNGTRSGEFDASYQGAPFDDQARSLVSEGFHWEQGLSPISYGILLNTAAPPLDDVRVRRAISMALNREEISEELFNGINPPVYQPFSEGYLGYDPSLDDDPYDPDAARALVREAGAEGSTVRIVQNITPPASSLAEVVQQSLADIGLEVELVPVSPTEALPSWRQGTYHGHVGTIVAQAEPSLTLASLYLGAENFGEKPAELVALAQDGVELPVDSAEREEKYQEISAYLVENPVHVPIVAFSTVFLARPKVVGSANLLMLDLGKLDFRRVGIAAS